VRSQGEQLARTLISAEEAGTISSLRGRTA
jgi:hypothetical protein